MYMTFRWFGPTDPIPLAHIRQIPGVQGVVSALYDVPVGERWPRDRLANFQAAIAYAAPTLPLVGCISVDRGNKLGRPPRPRRSRIHFESIRTLAAPAC